MLAIEQFIDNEVKSNDVVLFMKGTPQFPQCGFSGQVVQILDYLGVPYKGLNVLESDELRQGVKSYSQWPTIPSALREGRVRRRLRHHPRDVPGGRTAADLQGCRSGGPRSRPDVCSPCEAKRNTGERISSFVERVAPDCLRSIRPTPRNKHK